MHAATIADALIADSYDVMVVTARPELRAMSDQDLLVHAAAMERVIVTENVGDFMLLVVQWTAEARAHPGLILTNPKRFNRATLAYPGNVITALSEFLMEAPARGDSWTWWL